MGTQTQPKWKRDPDTRCLASQDTPGSAHKWRNMMGVRMGCGMQIESWHNIARCKAWHTSKRNVIFVQPINGRRAAQTTANTNTPCAASHLEEQTAPSVIIRQRG